MLRARPVARLPFQFLISTVVALSQVQAVTDNKIWDDGEGSAGAMRSVVAAQSRARKEEEAKQLAAQNAAHKKSLANVHAAVDDGDGIQF